MTGIVAQWMRTAFVNAAVHALLLLLLVAGYMTRQQGSE